MAEHLNISQSAYSQLEHGKRTLTLYEAHLLCKLFDKRMFELFPNHELEMHKSELFWVQKHEASFAHSAFSSEKRILESQNQELNEILQGTLSINNRLAEIFKLWHEQAKTPKL